MEIGVRALSVVGLVALGLAGLAVLGFIYSVHPPRFVSRVTPGDLGWSYEPVALKTRDGLTLAGWYVPRARGPAEQRAVIVLHGYPYDKGNTLGVTPFLHEEFDLLLFDFRYFGASEGAFTTVGHRERLDVLAAVEYLRDRGVRSIGVWGFSMGASAALLALPETDSIGALVVDSPYVHLSTMVMDYYRFLPLADRFLALCTGFLARALAGVWPGEVSPGEAARGSRVPMLAIHGAADGTIPAHHFAQLREILDGNPAAEFWLVDGADHTRSYALHQTLYEARVLEFFQRNSKLTLGGDV
jgi:pimeloyl-ACP methyl ester carboxylesterase